MDDYHITIRRGELREGGTWQARFTVPNNVTLTVDTRGVPETEVLDLIGQALTSLRGVVLSRWLP